MTRQFIFRHYWRIAIAAGGVAAAVSLYVGGEERIELVGTSIAAALAFCYFVQQQKLAETALFKELFIEFNRRYDEINEDLQAILHGAAASDTQESIVDYFNLCAEEYLFYQEGYIHEAVWTSWCRGMLFYFDREPFMEVWRHEVETNSYYGLTLDVIRAGAARPGG